MDERLKRSIERMKFFVGDSGTSVNIIAAEAEIILRYFYGGFLRMIFKMICRYWSHSFLYYKFIFPVFYRKEWKEFEREWKELEEFERKGGHKKYMEPIKSDFCTDCKLWPCPDCDDDTEIFDCGYKEK